MSNDVGVVMIGRQVVGTIKEVSLTFSHPHGLGMGDSLCIDGLSNRYRHVVSGVFSHSINLARLYRPSRGYAKHVRRQKAGKK